MKYARDLDMQLADCFVGMYVNTRTLDYGEEGRRAVQLFLDKAHEKRLISHPVRAEFAAQQGSGAGDQGPEIRGRR